MYLQTRTEEKKMKPGFTLLEVLVAIALSGLVGAAVFTGFFQANRGYQRGNLVIDVDERACLLQHVLDRDLSGAFVPLVWLSQRETTTTVTTTVVKGEKKETTKTKEQEKEKKEEPIENGFTSQKEGENTIVLSCITSNPLQAYNQPKPRIARVTYQLVPEKEQRGRPLAYRLFRNEDLKLKFAKPSQGNTKGFEVVDNIKQFSVEYTVKIFEKKPKEETKPSLGKPQEKKPEAAAEKKKTVPEEKKVTYETFKTWGEEQIKKAKRPFPHFVTTTVAFWDQQRKRDRTFVFKTAIIADEQTPEKKVSTSTKNENGGESNSAKNNHTPHPGWARGRS